MTSAGRPADSPATAARSGLAAAVALARELGLPSDEPRVLSSRGNLVVHLAPAPVVARVATLSAWSRHDPFAWLAREVAVAGHAARRGGPVVPPTDLADPGPHRRDGLAVSLWSYLPATEARPSPEQAGRALAGLHEALSDFPGELPVLVPARDVISEGLDALERHRVLDAQVLAALRARHVAVLAGLDAIAGTGDAAVDRRGNAARPVLHGDAHPGNLMLSADGWRWIDLEETCRGPLLWDLAVLRGQSGSGGDAAVAAYSSSAGIAVPEPGDFLPCWQARELEAAVWTACMAHQYPERYREVARGFLELVLGSPP